MSERRTDPITALGALALLLAVPATIAWGFGADRFGIIGAASGGIGLVLLIIGASPIGGDRAPHSEQTRQGGPNATE